MRSWTLAELKAHKRDLEKYEPQAVTLIVLVGQAIAIERGRATR